MRVGGVARNSDSTLELNVERHGKRPRTRREQPVTEGVSDVGYPLPYEVQRCLAVSGG